MRDLGQRIWDRGAHMATAHEMMITDLTAEQTVDALKHYYSHEFKRDSRDEMIRIVRGFMGE